MIRQAKSAACAGVALAALLALCVPAASQAPVFDYYGTWGKQDSDKNKNEWRENCAAANGDVLIFSPDSVTTRGAAWVYKDYPECKVIRRQRRLPAAHSRAMLLRPEGSRGRDARSTTS